MRAGCNLSPARPVDGELPHDLDWRSLPDPTVTTAVYMPVKTLAELAALAIESGLDPATPAVAISRATRMDEASVAAPIAELPAQVAEAGGVSTSAPYRESPSARLRPS